MAKLGKGGIIALIVLLAATGLTPVVIAQEERTAQEEVRITIAPAVPERGGLLLRQGQLELVPQFRYALQTDNVFDVSGLAVLPAIVIGTIDVEKTELNVLEASLTSRYGILDDLQVEVRVPWRYSHLRTTTTLLGEENTTDDTGLGDVEAGLSYQLFREKGPRPAVVTALRVRAPTGRDPFDLDDDELPTGTGFWGVQGIINAVKVRDPIVLYGNIGYTWNIEDDVDIDLPSSEGRLLGDARIDPGDVVEWGLGFAYAISPEFSVNLTYVHRISWRSDVTESDVATFQEGKIAGSRLNIPELKFGTVWAYTKGFFIDFNVSVGLSDDAPDFTAQLGFPIRYDLF